MIKRLHTCILMTVVLLTSTTVPVLAQGDGSTAANPIEISDQAGLEAIASGPAKHYKLTKGITLSGNWTPLDGFTGSLDGGGYTISNLTVSTTYNAGLFETIGENGTVKNLGITDGSVTATKGSVGGIAGQNSGTIQNCYTNVAVTANDPNGDVTAGGIAGYNYGTIQNCYTTGTATSEKGSAGGIAGYNGSEGGSGNAIQYCYATGAIEGKQAGGIAGEIGDNWTGYGNILNCIALNSSITGTTSVGRITGSKINGNLTNNYAAPSIPGTWAADDKGADKKNGANLTEDNFIEDSAFESTGAFNGWNRTDDWDMMTTTSLPWVRYKQGNNIKGQTSIPSAPYLVAPVTTITDKAGLADIVKDLSGSYKLGNDIALTYVEGETWIPIAGEFKGTLDGCGFVISNLTVTVTGNNYAGLFATIGEDGIVKNLGVTGTSVTGNKETGGIAGSNHGTIQNCYTNVAVTSTSTTANYGAGGIAGSNSSTIQNCYTTGAVTCEKGYAGGIAGSNANANGGVKIQYCYATGAINGNQTGGITGHLAIGGNIQNCIALNSSITGIGDDPQVGRITGYKENYVTTLAANHAAPSIPGIWADKDLTAKDGADLNTTNFTGDGATGAFDSWPTAAWNFTATRLPTLLGFKEGQTVIECAPYLIKPTTLIGNAAELAAFRDVVNKGNTYKGETVKLTAPITLSGEWTSIGSTGYSFNGTFDGDGYVITMSNATASLFNTINKDGTVKNLGVNATITSKDKVGGIAATNKGTIQRCYVEGSITSAGVYISGIADNQGTIEDCYTTVSITTTGYYSGGIAGGNYEGTIRRCYATGAISSPGSAGIAGTGISTNSIQNCIALNESITGTGAHARVANGDGTFTGNYASPAIAGTWDNIGADEKDGADLTAANFIDQGAGEGTFTAWSGDNWDFGDNTNLPTLKGFKADQPVAGITRKSVIPLITTIATAEDLATFRDAVNDDGESYEGRTVTLTANITVSDWAESIGSNNNKPFLGTFDGQGYVIDLKGSKHLFGNLGSSGKQAGAVRNLGVKVAIVADGIDSYGSIAGWNYGTIEQCYIEGTITVENDYGYSYAGGIAGQNYGAIRDCYSTVSITVQSGAGGIAQYNKPGGTIERCYATGAISAGRDVIGGIVENNGGIAGNNDGNITNCIALNIGGITGERNASRIIGENATYATLASNYASPLIPGEWSDKGTGNADGDDLTEDNFLTNADGTAFAAWTGQSCWIFGDNTGLPKLKTTGLNSNIVIRGQGDADGNMPARTDFLELPIEISTAVAYDAATHKDKNIRVTAGGIFTLAADGASLKKLTLEEGGQVVAEKAFKCDMLLAPHTLGNRWTAYGSPVTMNTVAETSQKFYRLAGYKDAGDQSWSSSTSSTTTSFPILALNLIATDADNVSVTLTTPLSEGTPVTIPADAAPTTGSDLNTGKFLFVANPTLKDVTVPVAYLLSADGTRFVRTEKAKVKPFQSYVVANAVTSGAILSLRVGNGTPTGNAPIALPDGTFRVWSADGQLHLSADTPHDVTVYNQSGRLVRRLTLTGEQTLALPRGIYFVNTTHITYKVSL